MSKFPPELGKAKLQDPTWREILVTERRLTGQRNGEWTDSRPKAERPWNSPCKEQRGAGAGRELC